MRWVMYQPGQENPPGPMVFVFCPNRAHEPRVARVACFYQPPGQSWQQMPVRTATRGLTITWQLLTGNQPTEANDVRLTTGFPYRCRYVLQCQLCGQSIPVRHETLSRALDKLAGFADAWEVELSSLRAILNSSKNEMARNMPPFNLPAEAIKTMPAGRG